MTIRGSVDVVTGTEVRGWAFAPHRREPVLVQAVLNHEILGEATANIHRSDLAAAGLGEGNSGYVIRLFRPIDPLYFPFVVVKVDGGDTELPRAPVLGFAEFFQSLFIAHPAVGRSRSVFGGLWTDRTDAAALLRGKMAVGQITPQTGAALAQLISDGFAIVALERPISEQAWQTDLSHQVALMLEDGALVSLLRIILDDNPLIVKAAWVDSSETTVAQPSARNVSPSPAECLELVIGFGGGCALNVVRDGHRLPEFTPYGASRWVSGNLKDGLSVAGMNGWLDHHEIPTNNAAVIGPGTLHGIALGSGARFVRILCLPQRGMPLTLATERRRTAVASAHGAILWL